MTILFSSPGTSAAPTIDASTVILLRAAGSSTEVFLLLRHSKSSFMASHHVFPGGRVDDTDSDPQVLARVVGRDPSEAGRLAAAGPERALAIHVAAVRETFEEAGVLLARRASGAEITFEDSLVAKRFREYRRTLWESSSAFADMLEREDLLLSADRLHYWARWITPSLEPKRFDARFFVVTLPGNQTPLHDHRETVAEMWLNPRDAATSASTGLIRLPPPTLRNLEELGELGSIDNVFAHSDRRAAAPAPIQPRVLQVEGNLALLLPWDPEYSSGIGEGAALSADHPLATGASRFVLNGEVWTSRLAPAV